ncbi:MAG: Flp family type IVb pilin [Rhizobiaceae bacterium]|nr:Flp family type IVb pilin [Rhizobiaceae bacterium]
MLKKFLKNTSGATAIEYAMIASLIGAAIVGGVTSLGSATEDNYDQLGQQVQNAG